MIQCEDGGQSLIVPGNFPQTFVNCGGVYQCPLGSDGKPIGFLAGCAGKYLVSNAALAVTEVPGRAGPLINTSSHSSHYVTPAYYNFSMADRYPAVLRHTARLLAMDIRQRELKPTVILGAPMAGIKVSGALAEELGCLGIFAEKKVLAAPNQAQRALSQLRLERYSLQSNDRVLICEDVVNNFSTTRELVGLVRAAGAEVIGISSVINRAFPVSTEFDGYPVMSIWPVPTPEYRQEDPLVSEAVQARRVIWDPKKKENWRRLIEEMNTSV
ncbi:MAG: phosphoribosyltransferase family protein [Candidatus Moraniibacteriota bacterium]